MNRSPESLRTIESLRAAVMRHVTALTPVPPRFDDSCPATMRSGTSRGLYSPLRVEYVRASLVTVDPFQLAACVH
jgi:hypothetical protein